MPTNQNERVQWHRVVYDARKEGCAHFPPCAGKGRLGVGKRDMRAAYARCGTRCRSHSQKHMLTQGQPLKIRITKAHVRRTCHP